MKSKFDNPWYDSNNQYSNPYYEVIDLIERVGDITFYRLWNSVIGVRNGVVITECVTVAGALRHLKETGEL